MNLVINGQGIAQRIHLSLSSSSFETIAPLLIEEFGPPTRTDRGEVQNRMGAKFEQVNYLWKGENDVEVYYSKYAGTIDKSSLNFTTKEDRELMGKSKANRRSDMQAPTVRAKPSIERNSSRLRPPSAAHVKRWAAVGRLIIL